MKRKSYVKMWSFVEVRAPHIFHSKTIFLNIFLTEKAATHTVGKVNDLAFSLRNMKIISISV